MMDGKAVRQKLIGSDDQRAVSPVIGVILMVAITVILAAVIAAFVMDIGGNQSANANAGLEITENPDDGYDVSVTSMGDNTQTVKCSDPEGDEVETTEIGGDITCGDGSDVIGVTNDGSENVLQSNLGE